MGISPRTRAIIRAVLWLEIATNLGNGLYAIIDPAAALQPLTNIDLSNPAPATSAALEIHRWFAAMGITFGGFLLLRLLNHPSLKYLLEALLLGDVIYLASLVPFTIRFGAAPFIVAPYALTLLMFAARLWMRLYEDWETYGSAGGATPASASSTTTAAGRRTSSSMMTTAGPSSEAEVPRRRSSSGGRGERLLIGARK
jgi:hypothetical protein